MSQDLQRIEMALRAADKAGNTEDAKRLARAYRNAQQSAPRQSAPQQPQPQGKDNAFEYSVDQAQRMGGKGLEAIGRATDIQQVADYGTGVVEQQDKDIAKGGYTPKYNKSLRDTFNEDGIESAVGWLGEKTAENSVSGGVALGGGLVSAAVATVSAPAAAVIGLGTLAASGTMGAGEAAFEQEEKVGDYDSALATGQGILIGILDKFGASKVIPASKLLKMTPKQIVDTLNKKGFANAAKEVAKKTGIEGVTEVAQEGVSMAGAASRGGEYTQKEVEDRSIDSFALGSTNAGAVQVVTGGASLVRGKPANLSDRAAQATFAQRLDALAREGNAEGKEFNLKDLDTTSVTGVRALMDLAHANIASDITNLESDLSAYLNVNDKSLTSQQKADRVRVKKLLQQARNKTKSVLGRSDFELLKSMVGGTADGKRLINAVKESQEQTKVWNAGMKGGLSKFTDNASPLPQGNNYSGQAALTNAMRAATFGGLAGSTAGASIPVAIGAVAGGRMIDAITGRRSKVRRYINRNKGNQGLGAVSGLGEVDKNLAKAKAANEKAKAKSEAETQAKRDKAFFLYSEGSPPVGTSPEGIYQRFTGMDRAGLELTIAEALSDPNLDPSVRKDLETLVESMKYGERVSGFSVRYINGLIEQNPEVAKRRVRPVEPESGLQTAIAVGGASGRPITPKEQGKLDNNARVNRLKEELEADTSVNGTERDLLGKALDKMLFDLGKNPIDAMLAIEKTLQEKGVPQELINKYVVGYRELVQQQQQARKGGDETPTPPTEPNSPQPPVVQPQPQPPVVQPQPQPPVVQPQPPVDRTPKPMPPPINKPAPPEVKDQLPKAEGIIKIFDIGNKGSVWENGISNVDDFIALGKALNLTIEVSKSQAAFDRYRKSIGYYGVNGKNLMGFNAQPKDFSRGAKIAVKATKEQSDIDVLIFLAHEISHTLEGASNAVGATEKPKWLSKVAAHPESRVREDILDGSFRDKLNDVVRNAQTKDGTPQEKEILKEINYIQNQLLVSFGGNPAVGTSYVRGYSWQRNFFEKVLSLSGGYDSLGGVLTQRQKMEMENYKKNLSKSAKKHMKYQTNAAELAVDPVWVYLANPKLMKEVAPETSRLIQQYFKTQAKSFPVSFHANPIAAILAIVLAGMVSREREEEEKSKQQPPQPLPPGQGILNA
jgi:hypothetical protein